MTDCKRRLLCYIYSYYSRLVKTISSYKRTKYSCNSFPMLHQFSKYLQTIRKHAAIAFRNVSHHHVPGILQVTPFTCKTFRKGFLHVVEFPTFIGQLPKNIFYHSETNFFPADFVEYVSGRSYHSRKFSEPFRQFIHQRNTCFCKLPQFLSTEKCRTTYLSVRQYDTPHIDTNTCGNIGKSLGCIIKFFIRDAVCGQLFGV